MSRVPRILAFAGSTREGSFNKQIVKIAAEGSREAGGDVTCIDLRDYPLPLFDEDMEKVNGKPENARILKQLMIDHQGFLIASPEYNSSITAVLKNMIDWISRRDPQDTVHKAAFNGKVVALMSASPAATGGMRGLVHLRAILGNIGCLLLSEQVTLPQAADALRGDLDESLRARFTDLGRELVDKVRELHL